MNFSMRMQAMVACLLWGSAFASAKFAFSYADPILLSGMRFTLAGLLLVPVMAVMRVDLRGVLRHWRFMLAFAFMQTFLQYGLFFMGLNRVPAAMSAIIIGAGPLFVAIMAHLTLADDRMTSRKIVAIALGLMGVVFISLAGGGALRDAGNDFWSGVGLLVASNLVGSYTNIMVVRRKDYNIPPVALTSFANFTGGVGLIIVSLLVERPVLHNPPPMFWAALVWLAIIPAGAFSLWYGLLQRPGVKVSELNVWKFMVPVFGCVLAWIILPDESPDWVSLVGMAVIVGALWLLQSGRRASASRKQ